MFQNFSSKHVPEQRRRLANPWQPFKSDNISIEWLHVLLGSQTHSVNFTGSLLSITSAALACQKFKTSLKIHSDNRQGRYVCPASVLMLSPGIQKVVPA